MGQFKIGGIMVCQQIKQKFFFIQIDMKYSIILLCFSAYKTIMCYDYDKSISIRSIIYHNYLLVLLSHTFLFSLISQLDLIVIYSVFLSFLHNVCAYSCSTFFFFVSIFLHLVQKDDRKIHCQTINVQSHI